MPLSDLQNYSNEEIDEKIGEKEGPVYLMCAMGVTSKKAAHYLVGKGFNSNSAFYSDVFNIIGGLNSYTKEIDSQMP